MTLSETVTITTDSLLKLEKVTIGYPNNELIRDIDFKINSTDKILFKAASGTGKSTLLKTILGEIEPIFGSIAYGSKEGVESFAVVAQTPFIFDETLLFNLLFDSSMDEEKVKNSLKKVGLNHLATHEKLHHPLDKNLNPLSGGELKRLEVARALLFEKTFSTG